MRHYSFEKALSLIAKYQSQKLSRASLGMSEDWFWTAQEIWPSKEFDWTKKIVAGINGSAWATPTIHLEFEDGTERWIECHDDGPLDDTKNMREVVMSSRGVLSGPAQLKIPIPEKENV